MWIVIFHTTNNASLLPVDLHCIGHLTTWWDKARRFSRLMSIQSLWPQCFSTCFPRVANISKVCSIPKRLIRKISEDTLRQKSVLLYKIKNYDRLSYIAIQLTDVCYIHKISEFWRKKKCAKCDTKQLPARLSARANRNRKPILRKLNYHLTHPNNSFSEATRRVNTELLRGTLIFLR